MNLARPLLAASAAILLAAPAALAGGGGHTVVPNEDFCAAVSDDVAACVATIEGMAAGGAIPEAFAQPAPGPAGSGDPAGPAPGAARLIELDATPALSFTDKAGTKVTDIPVTPGETVQFRVANTSGFAHSFYIGTEEEVTPANAVTDTGIPPWTSGVQELTWTVPESVEGLMFACTVPGHVTLMSGTFSVSA